MEKPPAPATVRPARRTDVPAILRLIQELAAFERLSAELDIDEQQLGESLFGGRPACYALVAEEQRRLVGYALFFFSFSTFKARRCLYLEDLFVTSDHRGRGTGRALLAQVARVAQQHDCPRLDWMVLDWNEPAIRFYRGLGAEILTQFQLCRLGPEGIAGLAAGPSRP